MQTLLISVHGKYCKMYANGTKRTEVRKSAPKQLFNDIVYIYNTETQQIEFKGILHDILKLKISDLKHSYLSETRLSLKEAKSYAGQKKELVLLDFFQVLKLDKPISISEMRKTGVNPPQSFYYLDTEKLELLS